MQGQELVDVLKQVNQSLAAKSEVFSLQSIYFQALPKSKQEEDALKGLTAFEYVNLCRYYEAEAYPIDFAIKQI